MSDQRIYLGLCGAPASGKGACGDLIMEKLQKRGVSTTRTRFSDVLRDTFDLWNSSLDVCGYVSRGAIRETLALWDESDDKYDQMHSVVQAFGVYADEVAEDFFAALSRAPARFAWFAKRVPHVDFSRENLQKIAQLMVEHFGEGALSRAMRARLLSMSEQVILVDGVRWLSDEKLIRSLKGGRILYLTASEQLRYQRTRQRGEKVGESEKTFEQFQQEGRAVNERSIPEIGSRANFVIRNEGTLERLDHCVDGVVRGLLYQLGLHGHHAD